MGHGRGLLLKERQGKPKRLKKMERKRMGRRVGFIAHRRLHCGRSVDRRSCRRRKSDGRSEPPSVVRNATPEGNAAGYRWMPPARVAAMTLSGPVGPEGPNGDGGGR